MWRNFLHEGIYDEVVDNIEPIIKSYKSYKAGENLIKHLSRPTLYVYVPKGYGIGCDCPWEPEHQCLIIIRNNELLYVGPSECLDAWGDEDDYYCIWNDENEE